MASPLLMSLVYPRPTTLHFPQHSGALVIGVHIAHHATMQFTSANPDGPSSRYLDCTLLSMQSMKTACRSGESGHELRVVTPLDEATG
jgi:hypothetical protein